MPDQRQLDDIQWGLDNLLPYQSAYNRSRQYYAGQHARMIDNVRLSNIFGRLFRKFRLNLCKPVVDSVADRLQITSFSVPDTEGEADEAQEVWKRNKMKRRAGQVHLESLTTGDAYVIVWPNDNSQLATFYPHASHEVAVEYSASEPGLILKAAKLWKPDKETTRLTLYYPDRVERYVSRSTAGTSSLPATQPVDPYYEGSSLLQQSERDLYGDGGQFFPTSFEAGASIEKAKSFTEYTDDGAPVEENPFGIVPVFHFANNADLGERGVSELWDAMPVQDALNKSAFDLLVGSEYMATPQRWATGIDIARDPETGTPINPFTAGAENIFVAQDPEGRAKFGQFAAADLTQLGAVMKDFSLFMAQVTQTPPHYFFSVSTLVSGESQKTAEQKLDAKVEDRTTSFGDVWAQAVALAVRMDRGLAADGIEFDTNWKDTKPRNEKESWEVAQIKSELGVSKEQILREMGYTDEQIEKFRTEDGGPGQSTEDPIEQLSRNIFGGNGTPAANPFDSLNQNTSTS